MCCNPRNTDDAYCYDYLKYVFDFDLSVTTSSNLWGFIINKVYQHFLGGLADVVFLTAEL